MGGSMLGDCVHTPVVETTHEPSGLAHLGPEPTWVDAAEWEILNRYGGEEQPPGEELDFLPLTHRFTPGLYIRQIFMPAGTLLTLISREDSQN